MAIETLLWREASIARDVDRFLAQVGGSVLDAVDASAAIVRLLERDHLDTVASIRRGAVGLPVVGAETGLSEVMRQVEQVAPTGAPVLIFGETGSGKEVVARAIHERSDRARGPVLRVNCGAIPPELVDSELFGHERGSFTGASAQRLGWFE